jgi:hypothetical protein
MTNGEKIVNIFKCEVYEPIVEDNIIHVAFDKGDSLIGFDLDWWNSEYPYTDLVVNVKLANTCKDCINKVLRPKVRKIMKRELWRDGLSR